VEEHRKPDLLLATKLLADPLVQLVQKCVERQTTGSDAFEPVTFWKQLEEAERRRSAVSRSCTLRSAVFIVPMIKTFVGTAKLTPL